MRKATVGLATALLALGLSPNPVLAQHATDAPSTVCTGGTRSCDPATMVSPADVEFLQNAAQGDSFEIALGKLVQDKAANPATVAFGGKLAADHAAALVVLEALAARYGVSLPTAMSDEQAQTLVDLGANSGLHFDDEFAELAVDDHKADIDMFEQAAKEAFNNDVRAFAAASLPILQLHLTGADILNAAIEALPGHEGDGQQEPDEATAATEAAAVTPVATETPIQTPAVIPAAIPTPSASPTDANADDESTESQHEAGAEDAGDDSSQMANQEAAHHDSGDHQSDHHKDGQQGHD